MSRTLSFYTVLLLLTLLSSLHAFLEPEELSYYGAIAYSNSTGHYGTCFRAESLEIAKSFALRDCTHSDGRMVSDAEIIMWGKNKWLAFAHGSGNSWGTAWGDTKAEAREKALELCRKYSSNAHIASIFFAAGDNRITESRPQYTLGVLGDFRAGRGFEISEVIDGGPCSKVQERLSSAGVSLKENDLIRKIGGVEFNSFREMMELLNHFYRQEKYPISITVSRQDLNETKEYLVKPTVKDIELPILKNPEVFYSDLQAKITQVQINRVDKSMESGLQKIQDWDSFLSPAKPNPLSDVQKIEDFDSFFPYPKPK